MRYPEAETNTGSRLAGERTTLAQTVGDHGCFSTSMRTPREQVQLCGQFRRSTVPYSIQRKWLLREHVPSRICLAWKDLTQALHLQC